MKHKKCGKAIGGKKMRNINLAHDKLIHQNKAADEGFDLTDIKLCEEQYQHYDIFSKQKR